ncbi:putative Complex 1 protein (LYR family) [Trypanosoma vivax]|uniref:Complex 1 LYR protein domain-containing protein n=1 Tax=Trypanosoma vivax (strain Y486) TaxID=1055687 RepID=G0U8A7_TRYVY|nr:hypothetical protein TRVL_05558 [Trypanosoma vivax]KAH8607259.1 putative Complex 1 protein (LYR family) [Trypanosoma vivax]CCC52118.1 conserved hypothetical protein [Trypanosoma vivax Y486]
MSGSVQFTMGRLRTRMLNVARSFPDYNFRHYFIHHVKDQFAAMEKWSVEEQRRFLRESGAKKLREMRRMALVNRLYASKPVFLDMRLPARQTASTAVGTAGSRTTGGGEPTSK